jgi:hypothetical protein
MSNKTDEEAGIWAEGFAFQISHWGIGMDAIRYWKRVFP